MELTVSELPGSRVSVEAEVPVEDVQRAVERAAGSLARDTRLPGFRKGKAPAELVIQRVGFDAVLDEALREALPEWYERALLASGVASVGDPSLEIVSRPEAQGEPFVFKFEIGVRPRAELGEYKGLEVGREEPEAPAEMVEREIERIQESFARLEPVERAAAAGDLVLIDFEGLIDGRAFEGGKASDFLLELGAGRMIAGFEEQLVGAEAGETRQVEVTFPDDYEPERFAGEDAVFAVEVTEVREKVLPELDDELAAEASEFETLAELREDIAERLAEALRERAEQDFRIAAVDAAVAEAKLDLSDELATARATERWERVERQLAGRGMSPDAYLQMQGKTREQMIEESKEEAGAELKREAVLAAIADAEGIDPSEEELVEALEHTAEHEGTSGEKLLERLRGSGRDGVIREDIRLRKAIDLVAESAKPIPKEQAEAREQIWTPEKEREEKGALWTPGDD